jgi:hypothetical protein
MIFSIDLFNCLYKLFKKKLKMNSFMRKTQIIKKILMIMNRVGTDIKTKILTNSIILMLSLLNNQINSIFQILKMIY